jgi:2-polyprenyl-6-methoxyphenol hydroxylase-like FAD-dependent oxidoreductase
MEVLIVGAGIGGLTLALTLHRAGIRARVFEAAPELRPVGLGINLLPHAARELFALGLGGALSRVAVETREAVFFNRFGQLIHREPLGRLAGYAWPQFSIHRGDLQDVLLHAVRQRLGGDCVRTGWRCTRVDQDSRGAVAHFEDPAGRALEPQRGDAIVGCDGLHSTVRKQLHPAEGEPLYSGVNAWRGTTRWPPFLTGASFVRAGWLSHGKLVAYPIRDSIEDGSNSGPKGTPGLQLVNWVAEIETPRYQKRDWNRAGNLEDFIGAFESWHFDWLDVPAFLRAADRVLEFPMVDQDPLPWWSAGRITLLGDAAHPMVPRGSNGAGQAILDAAALARALAAAGEPEPALAAYERERLEATARIVLTNRANPPDAILREVFLRTGDRPFERIEDVISAEEIAAISDGYKRVAGYDRAAMSASGVEP